MALLRKFALIVFYISVQFLIGCYDRNGCSSGFTAAFSGTVTDSNGNPLQDVKVKISVLGESPKEMTTTDSTGKYYYDWYRAASLGQVYLVFSKAGFSDYTSPSDLVGESCDDENIVTDAALTP